MRVPLPIIIILCLLATLVAWIIGTHDKDFTKSPTPKELVQITEDWNETKPQNPEQHSRSATTPADWQNNKSPSSSASSSLKPEKLPPMEFRQSPALSEFGTLRDKGTSFMIQLATQLEAMGQRQRALLAWERVIDTSNPTQEERQKALAAIKGLKNSLPPWNPDPINEIPLTLHAGATLEDRKTLELALIKTADLISEGSGNTIKVSTKASIGKGRSAPTKRIPVAIWFSRPGTSSDDTGAETPPISFMTDPSHEQQLASQIAAGAYSLIRIQLTRETNFSPLPELQENAGVNPNELLKYHITRLMWREFVQSLRD